MRRQLSRPFIPPRLRHDGPGGLKEAAATKHTGVSLSLRGRYKPEHAQPPRRLPLSH